MSTRMRISCDVVNVVKSNSKKKKSNNNGSGIVLGFW